MLSGFPLSGIGNARKSRQEKNCKRIGQQRREKHRKLLIEPLEDRRLLATRVWDGGGANDNWSTAANWDSNLQPVAGDVLQFAGTVRLSPVNDFAADTSFAGITFNSGADAFSLSGNRITLTGNVTNSDDSLQTINLAMILDATRSFSNTAGDLAVGGILSGAGGLTKSGTGTLTLSGANTYSGSTTVSNGILKLGASNVIPDGAGFGNVTVTSPGRLDMAGYDETVNVLTGNGTVDKTVAGSSILTVGSADTTSAFSGVIKDSIGTLNLTKIGTGTLTLSGKNLYEGVTNVQAGTLSITDIDSLSTSTGATVVSSGATLNLNVNNALRTIAEPLVLNGTGVGGAGALTLAGSTDVTLADSVTLMTNASIGVANAAQTLTLRGQVSGNGDLTKVGDGVLTLNNAGNDYAGNTVISAGKLQLKDNATVIPDGDGKGNVIVEANGTLELVGGSESINGLIGSGTIDNTALLARILTVGLNDQTSTFSGVIKNTGPTLSLTKQGTGTLTLSGANTYSGDTTISNGTLQLGESEVIPHGTGKGDVVMNGGASVAGILDLNGFDETINGLSGTSAAFLGQVINSAVTAKTLTVGADSQDAAFAGLIKDNLGLGGTVALTKTGSGTQTLSGTNTYTGPTTVNAGALLVNGSTAAGSDVTVNNGATLGGTGTIGGPVNVLGGGITAPGNRPGIGVLTYGSGLTIASGGNLNIDLATIASGNLAGTRYDQADVSGGVPPNVNIAGANLNITASGVNPNGVEQLMIVKNDGDYLTDPVNGKFAGKLDGFHVQVTPFDGYLSYFDGDGNDITLTTKNNAATVVNGTAGPDSFTLRRIENTVQVLLGTAVHGAWPYDSLTSLTINGGGEADTLTIQLTADGNPVPTGGVTFNGGSGNDTLDLSAYSTAMSGAVAGLGTTDGLRGTVSVPSNAAFSFDNLEVLTGGTASGDTLTGANLASVWNLDNAQTYVSTNTLTFSAFETLQGGAAADGFNIRVATAANLKGGGAADTFTFAADPGSLTGSIDGETGTNTLSYSGYTNAIHVSVSLPAGSATRVTQGISNLQNVTGGAGNDTLIGDGNANVLIGGDGNDALTDGAGNDTLNGGLGDDTFYLVPGSAEVINDTGGSDTVNFAAATAAITIDMDSTSQQTIDLSGNRVTLTGIIENFVGSAFNDTVSVDALGSNVTRSMSGGDQAGDVLNVDAKLQSVTDDGAQLSFSGEYGAITYGTFETLNLIATDVTVKGGSGPDTLVVTATGTQSGKYKLNSGPDVHFSSLAKLTFNADDGNDTLIINNPAGSFFAPTSGVSYIGGGQASTPGDTLQILGGTASELRFDYTDLHDGFVYYNGTQVISYTGLEPITSTIGAANVILNYSTATETITVTSVSATQTKAASTAGEETTFNNPSTLLRINGGDTNDDTINFTSISSGFSANLTVDGEGGAADQVNFNGAIDISSGFLTIQNVETIDVNAAVTADAGITFTAPTTTYLGAGLQTDGTGISITAGTVIIDAATVTVDTESNGSGNAGNVALGNTTIRADTTGRDLSINTSAPGTGGTVTLGTLTDGGGDYVDDLTINAAGSTNGNVNLTVSVQTASSILIDNAATVDINGDVTAGTSLTIQNASSVTIDASAARTLTSHGGDLSLATNVTQITLDGGSALVTLDANGVETDTTDADVVLGAVNATNPATAPSLTVAADGGVTFSTIDLNGTATDGSLSLTVDANNNGTETLAINGGITNVAALTLSGGGTGTNDTIDVNADLTTTAGALTIQNASSVTIDASAVRTLTSHGGDISIATNVTQITLDGGSALVTLDANGVETDTTDADVVLGAVNATNPATAPSLTVAVDGGVTFSTIDLNGTATDGSLSLTVDANNNGTETLAINGGIANVAALTLSGGGTGTNDTIDVNADLTTTAGALTIQNASSVTIDASAARTLTSHGGDLSIATNVTQITLDGGSALVTLDANGVETDTTDADVVLGAVKATNPATAPSLTVAADGGVTFSTIDLNGTATDGSLSLTVDANNNGTETLAINGGIANVASLTLSGGGTGTNDTIDVNADLTTTAGALTIQNASSVTIDASAVRTLTSHGGDLSIATNVTQITLDGGSALVTLDANGVETDTTDADVVLGAVNATNPATAPSLTVAADGGVTFSTIDLNGTATDGSLSLTVDANNNGTETLTINGGITNVASLTLSGGGTGTNDTIDVNADLTTTAGALTIQNASSVTIDASAVRTLTSHGGDLRIATNVTQITLDGGSALVTLDANGVEVDTTDADVVLGAVTATNSPNLTVNSEGDVNLASVNIGISGDLLVNVDNNNSGSQSGTFGVLTAGTINIAGTNANDSLTFNGRVTSNEAAGVTIGAGTIGIYASIVTTTGTGTVSIVGQNAVRFNADSGVNAGGTIVIAANQDSAGEQDFTQASGTTIQTASTGANAIRLTVNTGLSGAGNASIAALQTGAGGTVTIVAHGGAITDNNADAINITAGQATLSAATGIGRGNALETNIATLDALNTGTSGNIRIQEVATGIDGAIDVQQLRQAGASGSGNILLTTVDGTITVLAGGSGVSVASSGRTITLDANVTDGSHELPQGTIPVRGNVELDAVVSGLSGLITIDADHDVRGSTAGAISGGSGGIKITADANTNATTPLGNNNGTIQLAGDIRAVGGTVTFSLADCDGWVGATPNNLNGKVTAADIVMGVDANTPEGVLRLQGANNTFTGATTVVEGTLLVNGKLSDVVPGTPANGDVVVQSGGVLGGHGDGATPPTPFAAATYGVINASITVQNGGILDPGDVSSGCAPQTGVLTVNVPDVPDTATVNIQPGGTFRIQLAGLTPGAASNGYDQLVLNGNGNLNGATLDGAGGGTLLVEPRFPIPVGAEFLIISKLPNPKLDTRFLGLPEGAFLYLNNVMLNISYFASDRGRNDTLNNDVMLSSPGRYDFNGLHGYTADTYVPVSPFQAKPGSTFGWLTLPPQWFERNYPVVPPYSSPAPAPTDPFTASERRLRYDGQATDTLGNPLTFQVDVVAGRQYEVMILTGDAGWNHDKEQLQVYDGNLAAPPAPPTATQVIETWGAGAPEGGANIIWGGGTPNTAGTGYYRWVRFTTAAIADVGGGRGSIKMTMQDKGGGDPATVILAMDVRPIDAVGNLTIARTSPVNGGTQPLFDALDADGLTVDAYSGSGAPPGAALSITVFAGTPAQYAMVTDGSGVDQDKTVFGGQVKALDNGTFTFQVRRPANLAGTSSPEAWTILVEEISGLSRGTATQLYLTPTVVPMRFDFGDYNSNVAAGFLQVEPRTTYNRTQGYGWTTRVASKTRVDTTVNPGAAPRTDLRYDFNYSRNGVFRVDLAANKQYNVRLYHANPRNGTTAFVQGEFDVYSSTVNPDNTLNTVFRYHVGNILPSTTFDLNASTFTVTTGSNGALFLDFRSLGSFLVSGVEISAGALPAAVALLAEGDPLDGGAAAISLDMLQPVVAEAAARWSDVGLTPAQAATLSNVQFAVADLGGAYLGLANPATNQIQIDDDAAMIGWALGNGQRSVVSGAMAAYGQRTTDNGQWTTNGVDLLTVVMHELGHLLGHVHSDNADDLMAPVLAASPLRPSSFVIRPSSFDLRPSSFDLRPSSFDLRPSSFPTDDVFAELGRGDRTAQDSSGDTSSELLESADHGRLAAGLAKSDDEASQTRIPRRSRLQRYERELEAWFTELAAEEAVSGP